MNLLVLGMNHRTSPVELRERLHFSDEMLPQALTELNRRLGCACVILGTCNRVELYAHTEGDAHDTSLIMRAFLAEFHGVSEAEFTPHLYLHEGQACVTHLYRVAASLDSLIVGEGQIIGQVQAAFLAAQAAQTTDKMLSGLFQRALRGAKRAYAQTGISSGKVSIGSVAAELAVNIFMDLAGKTVLIIGSGKIGELTLKTLVAHGVGRVLLCNRSPEKAETLAEQHGGEALPFELLRDNLHQADIVITSTGSPEPVLAKEHFRRALQQRDRMPMFVIDIAVPRDVDSRVNELDDIYLYDMDNLQEVAERNLAKRQEAAAKALEIVERETEQFWRWRSSLEAEPTIVSMSAELNAIRERELQKTLRMLPDLDDKERAEIEYLTKRIVNNILRQPMTQLKTEMAEHDAPQSVLHLVKRLFGLEELT